MASKTKSKTQSVRIKELNSPGSGASASDFITIPVPLYMAGLFIKHLWKHRVSYGLLLLVSYLAFSSNLDYVYVFVWTLIFLLLCLALAMGQIALKFDHGADLTHIAIALYRRQYLKKRLGKVYAAAEIKKGFPKIRKLRFNPTGYRFSLNMKNTGETSYSIGTSAPEIAAALEAYEVKVDTPTPAIAEVFVSMGDPTRKVIRPGDIPGILTKNMIPFAIDVSNKSAIAIKLGISLLIVGRTVSGKSNILWEIINQLNKYGIPYRLRVIDPKGGVECSELENSPNTIAYCSDGKKADKLINDGDKALDERLAIMKAQGIRRLDQITEEFPLDILIVDELLHVPSAHDVDSAYGRRLTQGSAAHFFTIALSQLSQKDVLGQTRDLYPQRICMGVDSPDVTNAALGESAEKRGAKASEIPNTSPGIGYMFRDGKKGFSKLQAGKIEDGETVTIAQGGFVNTSSNKKWTIPTFESAKMQVKDLLNRETATYKLYNNETRHIYTGMAKDPYQRIQNHIKKQPWGHEIDPEHTEVEWFDNRKLAKQAETLSIKNDKPLYNKAENPNYRKDKTSV